MAHLIGLKSVFAAAFQTHNRRMDSKARLSQHWRRMSLASQFAAAGGVVLIIAALVVGAIVARRIEESVVRNTASATALYMESFVSPLSQQLADSDQLSVNAKRALNEIFNDTPLGERVVSYKIWKQGGRIVEASDPALVGQVFPVNPSLRAAWDGQVRAEFDDVEDAESAAERRLAVPLLELSLIHI